MNFSVTAGCHWYPFHIYAVQAAVLCDSTTADREPQETANIREDREEPYWPQSKRKPSEKTAENRGLNHISGKGV